MKENSNSAIDESYKDFISSSRKEKESSINTVTYQNKSFWADLSDTTSRTETFQYGNAWDEESLIHGNNPVNIVEVKKEETMKDFYSLYMNKCIQDSSKILKLRVRFDDVFVDKNGTYNVDFTSDIVRGYFTVTVKRKDYILSPSKFEKILIHYITKSPFNPKFCIENDDFKCYFNDNCISCLELCIPYILKAGKRSTFEWIEPIQDRVIAFEEKKKKERISKKRNLLKKDKADDDFYDEPIPKPRWGETTQDKGGWGRHTKSSSPTTLSGESEVLAYIHRAMTSQSTFDRIFNTERAKVLVRERYGKDFDVNFKTGEIFRTKREFPI